MCSPCSQRRFRGRQIARSKRRRHNLPGARPRANPVLNETASAPSTSRRKIEYFGSPGIDDPGVNVQDSGFLIVHVSSLARLVSFAACEACKQKQLIVEVSGVEGSVRKTTSCCQVCSEALGTCYSSPGHGSSTSTRPSFLVNRRMVETFVSLGNGYRGMQKFGIELGTPVMSELMFLNHFKAMMDSNHAFCEKLLSEARKAVRNVHGATEDELFDVCPSYDGTWQKRGHTSLNGAGFAIETITGLEIDFEVLRKYCQICKMKRIELGDGSEE